MAGRISLVEEYENKDMIVQVKKCLDQTEAAVEASETARDVSIASAAEAHEASTNANSASAQAQTAAQTVSTYESRLGAVENESAGNRSSIQTIDGEITDIYNDLTNVIRKVGDTEQIVYSGLDLRGTNRTPNTPVGQLNNLIVNAKRLIEEIDAKLDAYTQMVRTTGNQTISGVKTLANYGGVPFGDRQTLVLEEMDPNIDLGARNNFYRVYPSMKWMDSHDNIIGGLVFVNYENGTTNLVAYVRNRDGTLKSQVVLGGNP